MHLYLENFQSIRGPVRIDLAPITLLYGPNSAGKSAIHDAIRILSMMCENKWPGGNVAAFMHQHQFDQKMTLGIGGVFPFPGWYEPPIHKKSLNNPENLGDFLLSLNLPSLRRFIYPYETYEEDEENEEDTEEQYRCEWDIRFVFRFSEVEDSAGSATAELEKIYISASGYSFVTLNMDTSSIYINTKNPLMKEVNLRLNQDGVDLKKLCFHVVKPENLIIKDPYICISGGVFDCDDSVITEDIWETRYNESPYANVASKEFQQLESLLQYIIFAPFFNVNTFFETTHIGPLRVIPKLSDLQFFVYPLWCTISSNSKGKKRSLYSYCGKLISEKETSWEDGSAAWESLINMHSKIEDDLVQLKAVNDWLSSPEKLGTNFSIEITTKDIFDSPSAENDLRGVRAGVVATAEKAAKIAVIRLKNKKLGMFVPVHDVGVGIAQLIPILVAGIEIRRIPSYVFIEQPELHLHPKLQMQIADFFVSTKTHWIIETHSEHIALRLLRRLRESSRNTLENPEFAIKPDDLAFYYFDPGDTATEVKRLRVTPAGEFLDRWPKGFFAEREGELFDDID